MDETRPRARTTAVAAVLIVVVCIPFLLNGWELVRLAQDPTSVDADVRSALITFGTGGGVTETRNYAIIGATLMLGLSALALFMAVGVWRRRQGTHQAAVVTFAIFALIALASSLSGLGSDPPAPNAKVGLAVGLVNVGIVVLLMMESTREDIEYMDSLRTRRKYEREDARIAKRQARRS